MNVHSMHDLAHALRARGVDAVEYGQSGGNCATMFIGVPYRDASGDARFPLLAGPGWMTAEDAEFSTEEFGFGPDDDGESEGMWVTPESTVDDIAEMIVTALQGMAPREELAK